MSKHWLRAAIAGSLLLASFTKAPLVLAQPAITQPAITQPGTRAAISAPLDRGRLFDTVVSRVKARFWDPEHLKRERFDELATAARPAVLEAATEALAVARINTLLDAMKASHFRLHAPDELSYYVLLDLSPTSNGAPDLINRRFWGGRPYYAGIGAFTAEIDGKHFVDGMMEGSPADRAGLKFGDEITSVDGAPYHLIRSFQGKIAQSAQVSVRRKADGPIEVLAVPVTPIVPGLAFEQATVASARVIESEGKRIGYFRIWALFSDEPILLAMSRLTPGGRLARTERSSQSRIAGQSAYTSQLETLVDKPLDGMIVDLRGKVGGRDASDLLLGLLSGQWQSQRQGAPFHYRNAGRTSSPPKVEIYNPSFRNKSMLLTDHHTRSAGEMLSYSFRFARMGDIVGTPTVGHVLAAGTEVLTGDYILQIPQSRPEVSGEHLEGKGVAPDVLVERPLAYAGGADPVLEAAVKRLVGQLSR